MIPQSWLYTYTQNIAAKSIFLTRTMHQCKSKQSWIKTPSLTGHLINIKRDTTDHFQWHFKKRKLATPGCKSATLISTKLEIQDIDQTWLQNLDQDSTSLPLQNISSKIQTPASLKSATSCCQHDPHQQQNTDQTPASNLAWTSTSK